MSNLKSHCSLSYHNMPLDEIENFALGVKTGYFGNNPPFVVLPFTESAYNDLILKYVEKRSEYVNGGLAQKGPFLLAKTDLMEATDKVAAEVDKVADGNEEIIILAGFVPTKSGSSGGDKPGQPVVTVKRGISGELIATCAQVAGAKHYGCIVTEGAPLPSFVSITADGKIVIKGTDVAPVPGAAPEPEVTALMVDLTDQREKHFTGLKHDAIYYFYYYAVNTSGVSALSEVVSMVAW